VPSSSSCSALRARVGGHRSVPPIPAALRDSVLVLEPVWSRSERCYHYEHRFALEPGQSWVFAPDVLASEIVTRAGPGRYWFTAGITGRTAIFLAAGDVELGR
jgi:hypothetical protein